MIRFLKYQEGSYNLFNFNMFGTSGSNAAIFTALALFVLLLAIRIPRYDKITRDRMVAVIFFAFVTIFSGQFLNKLLAA